MAAIPGTRVIAPLVPSDSADVYPTHKATYGLGGHRSVATIAERDAIPAERREAGMLVYVSSTGLAYQLEEDLVTWTGAWSRALKQPAADGDEIADLPPAAQRANKVLLFDAFGDPTVGTGITFSGTDTIQVSNTAVLKSLAEADLTDDQVIMTQGYGAAGDGGHALYRWDAGSSAAEDLFKVFRLNVAGVGRFFLITGSKLNALQAGAKGDSGTNNAAAFDRLWGAASAGETVHFPYAAGTYQTTEPLPIKDGVNVSGDRGAVIEYVEQDEATMVDDGFTPMAIDFHGISFRRSGDGTPLAGAVASQRYTVHQSHPDSFFRFWDCSFDDDNWNITDGETSALITAICEGTAVFYGCSINGVGYGLFSNSGNVWFEGTIETAVKCIAIHGGTIHANGRFVATDAGATGRGTISCAAGTIYLNGDIVRQGDAIAPGLYCTTTALVYCDGNIDSVGHGIQMDGANAVCRFNGNVHAVAANALRVGSGLLRACGNFISDQSNAITVTGGTCYANGNAYAPYVAVGSKDGLFVTGGTLSFKGMVEASGSGINMSGGTVRMDGLITYSAVNNHAVGMSGGTLKIDGRIETELNGFNLTGATAKTLDIGSLDIDIKGANAARRGIHYNASTNNTTKVGSLRISVPGGAANSIDTNAGNVQAITAGKIVANVGISADVTVSAFAYAAP